MPNIVITEQDLTKPGEATESTDVVYVPGFINIDQDCLYTNESEVKGEFVRGDYIGLPFRTPMLFKDVESFETLCGERPYIFQEDQRYSDLPYSFAEDAIPSDDILIPAGTPDPGYVLAKELLSAGLQVTFERIDADPDYEMKGVTNPEGVTNVSGKVIGIKSGYLYRTDIFTPISDMNSLGYVPTVCYKKNGNIYTKLSAFPNEGDSVEDVYVPTGRVILESTTADTDYYVVTSNTGVQYLTHYVETDITIKAAGTGESTILNLTTGDDNAHDRIVIDPEKYYICTVLTSEEVIVDCDRNKIHEIDFDKAGSSVTLYEYDESTYKYGLWQVYNFFESDAAFNPDNLTGLIDRGNYSVKYLTSGGYPVYEYNKGSIVNKMLNFADVRGDCVALIDHTDNEERSLDTMAQDSLYSSLQANKDSFAKGDFGAMFTPWCTYNRVSSDAKYFVEENGKEVPKNSPTSFRAPASYAYLAALADSIKTNANWLAIAGAARGSVLNLANGGVTRKIPNAIADKMQERNESVSINPITEIRPYGQTIWGNRTLKYNEQDLVATSFLNIRNLISDVKKTCYRVARSLTFEQDTDVLWINFKSQISALLNRMQSGYGISGYKILRDTTRAEATKKAVLSAKVILYPTYAVEDFYIDIILKDDEVIVE